MKTVIFGLLILGTILVAPAYAECGGDGYEPFANAVAQSEKD